VLSQALAVAHSTDVTPKPVSGRRTWVRRRRLDAAKARGVLDATLHELRETNYYELVGRFVGRRFSSGMTDESGTRSILEIRGEWAFGRPGPIRIVVSINDGHWRLLRPLLEEFTKASDDSFVGEAETA
jgi:hypothetical protein